MTDKNTPDSEMPSGDQSDQPTPLVASPAQPDPPVDTSNARSNYENVRIAVVVLMVVVVLKYKSSGSGSSDVVVT